MENTAITKPVSFNLERLENIIRSQKNAIAVINGVPEITRPIAIGLWQEIRQQAMGFGLTLKENAEVLTANREMVIMKFSIAIYKEDILIYELAEIGECYADEKGKTDTMARVAYTRAMKRALERLVGEDFINQIVMSIAKTERPATERQIEFIKTLASKRKLTDEQLTAGLKKYYGKNSLNELTFDEASNLIERLKAN